MWRDTDQIIPARYLTAVTKEGMGDGLFSSWRYNANGSPKPDFVLNKPEYKGAKILIAGRNFGSGSSREARGLGIDRIWLQGSHLPSLCQHLLQQFAQEQPFASAAPEATVNMLLDLVEEEPEISISINLEDQLVTLPDGQTLGFPTDPFRKLCLLNSIDDLGYIQSKDTAIVAYRGDAGVLKK